MSGYVASVDLPLNDHAPAVARRLLRDACDAWGFTDAYWLAGADLIITELVTNAIRHGGGQVALEVRAHEDRVTVSVADGSAVVPRLVGDDGAPDRATGRGVAIIAGIAEQWGVESHEGGKRVWALLPPHPGRPGPG